MNLNALISEIRKRIDAERSAPEWRNLFSDTLKRDIVSLAKKYEVKSEAALQMGVSQSVLSRWMEQYAETPVAPRKLLVVDNAEPKSAPQQPLQISFVEAVLPNGVVLKNFPLTQAALFLLRGVQ